MIYIPHQKCNQIKEDEMGRTCGMHGSEQKSIWDFERNSHAKDHLKDLGIDGRIILQWTSKKEQGEDIDWINLAHGVSYPFS
jgi:hypothetical protein